MLRKIGALAGALAVVMVSVTAAQQPVKPRATHATIGIIKQVDVQSHIIVVTPIGGTDQSYAFSEKTVVHGLPGNAAVPALANKLGEKLVLHFAVGEKPEALAIEFLGNAEIQQASGTVIKVEPKDRELTLKLATGTEEEFHFAPRVALDMKGGLVRLTEFTRLTNVVATVYYTTRGKEKLVWYLQEAAAPAVSVR